MGEDEYKSMCLTSQLDLQGPDYSETLRKIWAPSTPDGMSEKELLDLLQALLMEVNDIHESGGYANISMSTFELIHGIIDRRMLPSIAVKGVTLLESLLQIATPDVFRKMFEEEIHTKMIGWFEILDFYQEMAIPCLRAYRALLQAYNTLSLYIGLREPSFLHYATRSTRVNKLDDLLHEYLETMTATVPHLVDGQVAVDDVLCSSSALLMSHMDKIGYDSLTLWLRLLGGMEIQPSDDVIGYLHIIAAKMTKKYADSPNDLARFVTMLHQSVMKWIGFYSPEIETISLYCTNLDCHVRRSGFAFATYLIRSDAQYCQLMNVPNLPEFLVDGLKSDIFAMKMTSINFFEALARQCTLAAIPDWLITEFVLNTVMVLDDVEANVVSMFGAAALGVIMNELKHDSNATLVVLQENNAGEVLQETLEGSPGLDAYDVACIRELMKYL